MTTLTDSQLKIAMDMGISELLTEESVNEMAETLKRFNDLMRGILSRPYDYENAMLLNKSISVGSQFRSICLKDRIEREFLIERAQYPKMVAVYFTLAIEIDPLDYFHIASIITDISWEEFVDMYIRMYV